MEQDQWVWVLEQVVDVVFVHQEQVMPLMVVIPMLLILLEVILTLVIPVLLVQAVVDFPEVVVEVVHLVVVEAEVEGIGKTAWQFTIFKLIVFEQTKRR